MVASCPPLDSRKAQIQTKPTQTLPPPPVTKQKASGSDPNPLSLAYYKLSMEEENGNGDGKQLTAKRSSMKTQSGFNNYSLWKNKLREKCYKRVREDRSRLLWKMRLPTNQSHDDTKFIETAFRDIVADELKKIKESSVDDNFKVATTDVDIDDISWEYEGPCDDYHGECEEILLEMQRIFYQDLRAEPVSKESKDFIITWEDEEDEYLAEAVFEHMKLNDNKVQKTIYCPICKRGELQEKHQLICCNNCELQLNKGDEVNLDILQTRLADAHAEHLDRGCRLKPQFCVEHRFGLTALYIVCDGCNTFEIVI